jgi:hypothetical protein
MKFVSTYTKKKKKDLAMTTIIKPKKNTLLSHKMINNNKRLKHNWSIDLNHQSRRKFVIFFKFNNFFNGILTILIKLNGLLWMESQNHKVQRWVLLNLIK